MIHYFPLEHLEQRYTRGMDEAICQRLDHHSMPYCRYYPDTQGRAEQDPGSKFFFHPAATIEFRSLQIADFARRVEEGGVDEGDIVFLSDLLLPGIEAIGWLDRMHDLRLDIRGLLHAGSFTDADMTRKWERWAAMYETVAFDLARWVFVGTEFIKTDVCAKRLLDPGKVIVTGFPADGSLPKPRPWKEKENIVVFTGRDSPEKQPRLFEQLARHKRFDGLGYSFINAVRAGLTKAEYHDLLSRAKVVVSFALQETYGVGIQEGVRMGCVPIVPDRECYPEQFKQTYLYDDFEVAAWKVERAMLGELAVPDPLMHESSVYRWFSPVPQ